MKINEVFEANDEYTRDELVEICSNLLICSSSLTEVLVEDKIKLLKSSDYLESTDLDEEIRKTEISLKTVNKLYESIFNLLYKGENHNEM